MYAFGVILWAMLTGEEPWKGYPLVSVAYSVHCGRRLPLDDIPDSRCPRKMRKLVEQCWEPTPRRRPAVRAAASAAVCCRGLLGTQTMIQLRHELHVGVNVRGWSDGNSIHSMRYTALCIVRTAAALHTVFVCGDLPNTLLQARTHKRVPSPCMRACSSCPTYLRYVTVLARHADNCPNHRHR